MNYATDLISVDVGGTLGIAEGPGLTMRLMEASPLDPHEARSVMRGRLHTKQEITGEVVGEICAALRIPEDPSLFAGPPAPFALYPTTLLALQQLASIATVVTLSNVTCVDADTERLTAQLNPHVSEHFPSCRIGFAKPDTRAFHAVTQHCDVVPSQMLHIGDDWRCDILGAVNAGIRAVWISHGKPVPDETVLTQHDVLIAEDLAAAARNLIQQQHLEGR